MREQEQPRVLFARACVAAIQCDEHSSLLKRLARLAYRASVPSPLRIALRAYLDRSAAEPEVQPHAPPEAPLDTRPVYFFPARAPSQSQGDALPDR
jgi:hypothetical protein